MTTTKPPQAEFVPNRPEITLARKCDRIDRECDRRIQAHFPLQQQIYIFAGILAGNIGYQPSPEIVGVSSGAYILAKDAARAAALAKCIIDHRLAADALKSFVSRSPGQINSIDVSAPKYWPAEPKGKDDEN